MKVLQITERYPPDDVGGAEIHVMHLAEALRSRGIETSIASFSEVPGVLRLHSRERAFKEEYWENHGRPEYITSSGVIKPFLASGDAGPIISSARPDVVHIHNLHDYSLAREVVASARRAGARIVWTVHDYWFVCPYATLLDKDGRICSDTRCFSRCLSDRPLRHRLLAALIMKSTGKLRRSDTIIAPSNYMAGVLKRWGVRAEVVPYGHPQEPFASLNPPAEGLRILYAGALEPHKGIDTLMKAFDNLPCEASLRVVGGGTLLDRMSEWSFGRHNIELITRVPHEEMADHYAWSSVVVLPSLWPDNLPLTIIEAMLSGRPVVASSAGGIPEMVSHRSTGLLFTPGDWEGLASSLRILTRKDIIAMGRKARKRALEEYDMEAYTNRIISIYGGDA